MSYYIYGPTDKMNFINLSLKSVLNLLEFSKWEKAL